VVNLWKCVRKEIQIIARRGSVDIAVMSIKCHCDDCSRRRDSLCTLYSEFTSYTCEGVTSLDWNSLISASTSAPYLLSVVLRYGDDGDSIWNVDTGGVQGSLRRAM
jgi:hypothetical protein